MHEKINQPHGEYMEHNYNTDSTLVMLLFLKSFFKRQNVPSFQEGIIKVKQEQRNEKRCLSQGAAFIRS